MPQVRRGARNRRDAPVMVREPHVVRERRRRSDRHRAGTHRASWPLRFETECAGTELREVTDVRPLKDEPEGALAVAEHEERGDEDDQVYVEAAERRRTLLDRALRRPLGHAEVNEPSRQADDEQRDSEARLLAIEVSRAVELVEDERQAGEAAGRSVQRDLGADAQKVRDGEDDHVDRDERDEIEVRALDGRDRPHVLHDRRHGDNSVHGRIMTRVFRDSMSASRDSGDPRGEPSTHPDRRPDRMRV